MSLAFSILIAGLGIRAEEHLIPILEGHGYIVRKAIGLQAILDTLSRSIDLLLLDMPAEDGLSWLSTVRGACTCPILVIGPARDDRLLVASLERGADDYVQRPFRTDEILARIRAQLRRRERTQGLALTFGPLNIDPHGRQATCNGAPLDLTPEEFALLVTLAARPGFACPATLLIEQVWGQGQQGNPELLDRSIQRLRALVEPDPQTPTILGGDPSHGYWLGGISQERELNDF